MTPHIFPHLSDALHYSFCRTVWISAKLHLKCSCETLCSSQNVTRGKQDTNNGRQVQASMPTFALARPQTRNMMCNCIPRVKREVKGGKLLKAQAQGSFPGV